MSSSRSPPSRQGGLSTRQQQDQEVLPSALPNETASVDEPRKNRRCFSRAASELGSATCEESACCRGRQFRSPPSPTACTANTLYWPCAATFDRGHLLFNSRAIPFSVLLLNCLRACLAAFPLLHFCWPVLLNPPRVYPHAIVREADSTGHASLPQQHHARTRTQQIQTKTYHTKSASAIGCFNARCDSIGSKPTRVGTPPGTPPASRLHENRNNTF